MDVMVVRCDNRKALDFLSACIDVLNALWHGMELEITVINKIPNWTMVIVWFPFYII